MRPPTRQREEMAWRLVMTLLTLFRLIIGAQWTTTILILAQRGGDASPVRLRTAAVEGNAGSAGEG